MQSYRTLGRTSHPFIQNPVQAQQDQQRSSHKRTHVPFFKTCGSKPKRPSPLHDEGFIHSTSSLQATSIQHQRPWHPAARDILPQDPDEYPACHKSAWIALSSQQAPPACVSLTTWRQSFAPPHPLPTTFGPKEKVVGGGAVGRSSTAMWSTRHMQSVVGVMSVLSERSSGMQGIAVRTTTMMNLGS
jgi:hypothetical protein